MLAVMLGVALTLPYVIDWNQHRATIVALLERSTGSKFDVDGDIDLKLLPSPQLRLGKVRVSGIGGGAARLDAGRIHLELGLTPLLRGELRFVDIAIERARLHLVQQQDGGFIIPAPPDGRPEQIAFERVLVREAEIFLRRPTGGEPLHIVLPLLEAAGQSLAGPFRGSGSIRHGNGDLVFSFNTGIAESAGIRIKLVSDATKSFPRAEFDGVLSLTKTGGGRFAPAFDGTAAFAGNTSLPSKGESAWRITGPLVADVWRIESKQFELRLGEETHMLAATGVLQARLSPVPDVRVTITAPQINADGLLDAGDGPARAMQTFAAGVQTAFGRAALPAGIGAPVHAEIGTPALTLGGQTLSDVALVLDLAAGKPAVVNFKTGAPGSTALSMQGRFEGGIAPVFRGDVEFSTRDMRRLQDWLAPAFAQAGTLAGSVPYRSFSIKGKADVSKAGLSGRDLTIIAGRTRFDGAMIYTRAIGTERARLHIDMNSPQLDIDGLGDFSGAARALGDTDIFLAMDARAVRLARFGSGMIDAGRIAVRLERDKGALKLTKFDIRNLGAANVSATAALAHGAGWLDVLLDAKNLVELSRLLQRVAPGPWTQAFATRAASLSPAKLRIMLRGRAGQDAQTPVLRQLKIEGELNGTRIAANASPQGDTPLSSGSLAARNARTAVLLRQLGLETIAIHTPGAGAIDIRWTNGGSGKTQTHVVADLAETRFEFRGEAGKALPTADFRGKLSIKGRDAAPLLQTLAVALPDITAGAPVDLAGDLAWRGNRVSAGNIAGTVMGAKLAGHLAFAPRGNDALAPQRVLTGDLRFDRLSLRGLATLLLGPAHDGAETWSPVRFGKPGGDVAADKIRINAGRFTLPGGLRAEAAQFLLSLAPGLLALEDITLRAGNVRATGRMSLRRDKGAAAMSGQITVDAPGAAIGAMTGHYAGTVDFAATGDSERAMVAGLAGRGSVTVKNFAMADADTRALQQVMALAQGEKLEVNEAGVLRALGLQLSRAPLRFAEKTFALSIAGGVARLTTEANKNLPGAVDALVSAAYDLRSFAGESRLDLTARERPKDWTGALPSITIVRSAGAARNRVLAASLVNGLSAMAILREAERVEALEFDIRERAYFNRRIKAAQYLSERRREIRAWHAEQARLAEEAYIRADESERKAADEAQKALAAKKRREEERSEQEKKNPLSAPLQLVPRALQPGPR